MNVDNLYKAIDNGRLGLNKGLPSGLPKLDTITYGILRENITLIGASSGAGKSSLAVYIALYNAYKAYLENSSNDVWWLVFSFEMSETSLMARLISMHLYEEYNLVVPHKSIFSLEEKLPDDVYEKVIESKKWLSGLAERCTVIDKPVTSKGLYAICKTFAEKHGKFTPITVETENGSSYDMETYTPNNSQQYLIALVDHVKLLKPQTGHTSKQEIDETCQDLIYFRDKCKFTIYMVQQLNRGFQDMKRRTEAGGAYSDIQLSDFSDTGDTVNAANTVLSIFFPYREKLTKWKNYTVDPSKGGLGDRLRTVSVLKNRDSEADKYVGISFWGECHTWNELPKPTEMGDYGRFLNP